jgi:hypothetical protein
MKRKIDISEINKWMRGFGGFGVRHKEQNEKKGRWF